MSLHIDFDECHTSRINKASSASVNTLKSAFESCLDNVAVNLAKQKSGRPKRCCGMVKDTGADYLTRQH